VSPHNIFDKAILFIYFFAKSQILSETQPVYSVLALCYFLVFPKLKVSLETPNSEPFENIPNNVKSAYWKDILKIIKQLVSKYDNTLKP
jgi:hypothetical protein